jgi:hypothetical protein
VVGVRYIHRSFGAGSVEYLAIIAPLSPELSTEQLIFNLFFN